MKRYLILAEGHSPTRTTARRCAASSATRRDEVVALLDSEHAGESTRASRSSGASPTRSVEPDTALVGVAATAGGSRGLAAHPPGRLEAGLDVEAGMHEFLADDPELAELARRARGRAPGPPPAARGPDRADGREPRARGGVVHTVGSDCAIGKKTMALELDREARERGLASVFVPTGQTGIAIAGLGNRGRRRRRRLRRGRGRAARRRGREPGDLLWVEGQGSLIHP